MSNYIYALLDENDTPFYIGKTNDIRRRSTAHRNEAENGNPLPKYRKLRKLFAQGLNLNLEILEQNISDVEVDERERHHIQQLKNQGCKLYNLTDGGDGMSPGHRHSEETKKKLSEAAKGRIFSSKHRKNLSVSRQTRMVSLETCRKMSVNMKGRCNTGRYKLFDPEGNEHITTQGLTLFCEQHDLTPSNLHKVLRGERSNHKGWRIERC